jgi:hypothetical protein
MSTAPDLDLNSVRSVLVTLFNEIVNYPSDPATYRGDDAIASLFAGFSVEVLLLASLGLQTDTDTWRSGSASTDMAIRIVTDALRACDSADLVRALACITLASEADAVVLAYGACRQSRTWSKEVARSTDAGLLTPKVFNVLFDRHGARYRSEDFITDTLNRDASATDAVFTMARTLHKNWTGSLNSLVETARLL